MRRPAPSTGIPIALHREPHVTYVSAKALLSLAEVQPGGMICSFIEQLPAMHPPIPVLDGDGESDELRAAAAPRFFRVMPDEAWRRSRWTLAASVGVGCFVLGYLCGVETVLVALLRGWVG